MLMHQYDEFAAKIDELNEVGSAYDASLKGVEISTTPIARSTLRIYNMSTDLQFTKLNFQFTFQRFGNVGLATGRASGL